MRPRRQTFVFGFVLALAVAAFFHQSLFGGKVLSPADVLLVSASFRADGAGDYEPANRLLMDPVLQFEPWLEFNRTMVRAGRLPLWNAFAGCGAPHLANGQSAVFDPFHWIAYLGTTPAAYAWIAAARLWVAGLGMFLLAQAWGLRAWGAWFAGMVYPFCGFNIVWLLFPVTSVAVFMPWLFLATDWCFRKPGPRSTAAISLAVALTIFGGHIQTSAHVLMAAGFDAIARMLALRREPSRARAAAFAWAGGIGLGLGLAAVQIIPLGVYLTKSSVWSDRREERPPWWKVDRPRVLDAACTAIPYLYGSQRRGHPNLARALGVHNLNESAGGYAGLITLIWLLPLALAARGRSPRVTFLAALVVVGAMGAFRVPPVDNLLRVLPVLDVTDHRRLTLWVAFGLALLGGIGLDQLSEPRTLPRPFILAWFGGALILTAASVAIPLCESRFRAHAIEHYRQAADETPGASSDVYRERALRQVRRLVDSQAPYLALVAIEIASLAVLALHHRRSHLCPVWLKPVLLSITMCELAAFGFDLNPAISRTTYDFEPPVVARLRAGLPPDGRALGIGEELPPNTLMRFGLKDVRNYDSVELASNLRWLAPVYVQARTAHTSRSTIDWSGVKAARDRLIEAGAHAIVASTPPPAGEFDMVESIGQVFIAWQRAEPWASSETRQTELTTSNQHGLARVDLVAKIPDRVTIRETWDPGWTATLDGQTVEIKAKSSGFMIINIPPGQHTLILIFDPVEVRVGLFLSSLALIVVILVLTGNRLFWIPGITMVMGLDGAKPTR